MSTIAMAGILIASAAMILSLPVSLIEAVTKKGFKGSSKLMMGAGAIGLISLALLLAFPEPSEKAEKPKKPLSPEEMAEAYALSSKDGEAGEKNDISAAIDDVLKEEAEDELRGDLNEGPGEGGPDTPGEGGPNDGPNGGPDAAGADCYD